MRVINSYNTYAQYGLRFMAVQLILGLALASITIGSMANETPKRPNVLLVVADDLGFTDLGAFGGEINTPNIDDLAKAGKRFANFSVAATCSPTRSMLLSGVDHHRAGLGNMIEHRAPNQVGQAGYEGYLNHSVVSLATLLKDAGYHTYMAGKWHLGMKSSQTPDARGFEDSFVLLQGGASHFSDKRGLVPAVPQGLYRDNGRVVETLPADFYSSSFYTDKMIDYIDKNLKDGKPFFGYLAFSAPHWPLQAPDDYIDRYRGKYDEGYDALRRSRLEKAKQIGIVPATAEVPPMTKEIPSWQSLTQEQKKIESRKMEIYAAMVENIDHNLGRFLTYLKDTDNYENTFIIFMSDNGADGADRSNLPGVKDWLDTSYDQTYANMGRENSYVYYGAGWAQAGMTPLKMYKSFVSEGGIRSPAIFSHPSIANKGQITHEFASVLDIVPTVLEIAEATHPGTNYQGRDIHPLTGNSLLGFLMGEKPSLEHDAVFGWELFGHKAIRKGQWKLLRLSSAPAWLPTPEGANKWQLYDLSNDPGELHDVSDKNPQKLKELLGLWEQYAAENRVITPLWDDKSDKH